MSEFNNNNSMIVHGAGSTRTANPFGSNAAESTAGRDSSLVTVEQEREVARIKGMIYLAKQFPRNEQQCMERILNACRRPSLAEVAVYSYPKGKDANGRQNYVKGPSIRLAEVAAQHWGNLWTNTEEVSREGSKSRIRTTAWDLETNRPEEKTFVVSHMRNTKNGSYAVTDEREVYEMVANYASRRLRACILSVIPRDVIEAAVEQCEKTLLANVDTSPERLKQVLTACEKMGVTKDMIEKRIGGRRFDTITPAQMVDLQSVFISIRDGIGVIQDYFEVKQVDNVSTPVKTGAEAVKQKIKGETAKVVDVPSVPVETSGQDVSELFPDDDLEAEMLRREREEADGAK